jgi:superfamily I DNA and/or RNA helicase
MIKSIVVARIAGTIIVWSDKYSSCYHLQASTNVEPVSRPVAVLPSPFEYQNLSCYSRY